MNQDEVLAAACAFMKREIEMAKATLDFSYNSFLLFLERPEVIPDKYKPKPKQETPCKVVKLKPYEQPPLKEKPLSK